MSNETVPDQHTVPQRRSHADIVRTFGATKLRSLLIERGFELPNPSTTQRWADRDSIPGEYWNAIASEGVATLEELAEVAEARKTAA
jgi:hypothetical protein